MGRTLPAALGSALDEALMRPILTEVFQDLLGPGARIAGVRSEIVKHRTVRYTVALEGEATPSWRVIGKVYETRAAAEGEFAALRWMWTQGFSMRPPLSITLPRALALLPDQELLLMEEAGGRSLKRLLHAGTAGPAELRAFAEVLLKLHELPASYGAPLTLDQYLALRCRGECEPLAGVFPELAHSVNRIVATARKELGDGGADDSSLVHGDFHPGQVHLDGERSWLIDLDAMHQGDPAYDVAMVVVTLKGMGARQGSARPFQELAEHFLAAYFSRANLSLAERVPLHAALIFLKRACKRFHFQNEPEWQDDLRLQLALGEECLDRLERSRRPRDRRAGLELCASCPAAV